MLLKFLHNLKYSGKISLIFFGFAILMLMSCKDTVDVDSSKSKPHNPNEPVVFTSFSPEDGKIRERVVIKGSNFGNDLSKVAVYFVDESSDRKATVIGVSDEAIFCLAPRQSSGPNKIKVVINGNVTVEHSARFTYAASEMVSTLITDNGTDEGPLGTVNFKYSNGIGYLGDESLIIFDMESSRVRLVSVLDNKVINLQAGFRGGKPAVNKAKTKAYAVGRNVPHTIYMYSKDSGWSPSRLGELGNLTSLAGDYIGALALSEDEEWLYFCSNNGVFGRFGIKDQALEIINQKISIPTSYATMPNGAGSPYWDYEQNSYLIYHPLQKCFYLSITAAYSIYKIDMNGNAQLFAGQSNKSTIADGYLTDCTFTMPQGMAIDSDGNIYVNDGSRAAGHCIRKIVVNNGFVSTVAGKKATGLPALTALADGSQPLLAVFRLPTDICYDGSGGFYVLDGWGRRLRKYAVE